MKVRNPIQVIQKDDHLVELSLELEKLPVSILKIATHC